MEIDKMQIAQLHQLYGELTLQLELLSAKHNQVKSQIMRKAQEMQQFQMAANKSGPTMDTLPLDKEKGLNGVSPEAA